MVLPSFFDDLGYFWHSLLGHHYRFRHESVKGFISQYIRV